MKPGKDKEILIVDDSTTNVVLVEAVLSELGYQIIPTLSAKEAFKIMEKKLPDLILLDLLMPRISGYDFLAEIKKTQRTSNIPVIVISAVTDEDNVRKIKEAGADEFIAKPLDIQTLIDKVERVFAL